MSNKCLVEGCDRGSKCKGLCRRHYSQMWYYGKILERTIHDPNEFIIDGDICWIILRDKQCKERARAKFLTIYYEQIKTSDLKWHLNDNGYVISSWINEVGERQDGFLHEAIIQLSGKIIQPGEMIDHKDGNKLNCLDDNLRICTMPQNQQNRGKQKNNTSGHKGVSWHKKTQKWRASINVNSKRIHLGLFDIIEDAARAYNAAAIIYHGEFAVLNNV